MCRSRLHTKTIEKQFGRVQKHVLCAQDPYSWVFVPTETHRTMEQDGHRVQISEDLTPAHCGHCSYGYWRSSSGVWSGRGCRLFLVKTEEQMKPGYRQKLERANTHSRARSKEREKLKTFKWDIFMTRKEVLPEVFLGNAPIDPRHSGTSHSPTQR